MKEQVTNFTKDEEFYNYESIARVRVLSHRTVPVPDDVNDIDWGQDDPPYMGDANGPVPWVRSRVEVTQSLYGQTADEIDLLAPQFSTNMPLVIGKEYILFLLQVVNPADHPGDDNRIACPTKHSELLAE